MGADYGDPSEAPLHEISLKRPFAIGRYKVTFAEWDACVADGGCGGNPLPDDSGWGRGERPVINVSWDDIQGYLEWLRKRTGKSYRLPTEAEWEFAARAGATGPYSFAGPISPARANYNAGDAEKAPSGIRFRNQTVPVNLFEPNGFGLYQVHGNAYEWVDDCWSPNYRQEPRQINCDQRVIRAGSWSSSANELRVTWRGFGLKGNRNNRRGFRVARNLP
jgi:formylglycine-generating enzyme required for sulfatase activity